MTAARVSVVAAALDDAGCGVGMADDGALVHVVDLLPGEAADVAIDHASPHRAEAWARVVRRSGPASPDRVVPACPAFGRCGGCAWQHLGYPAQLAAKRERVARELGVPLAAVSEVRPSPATVGYRNKGKYVVGTAGGQLVLGAYAPRSHRVVDTLGCRVVAPIIDEVASWIRGAAERAQLIAYDERARTGELRYAIVREVGGDVMVTLVVASGVPRNKLERVANALARHAAVRGVIAIVNDRRDGAIVPSGSSAQVLLGQGHLALEIAGVTVEVGASEFLQVNHAQAEAMYARVAELALQAAPASPHVVELYAGLGGIGLHLATRGARVTAVEIDREAVAQLRRAAERAQLPITAIAADAASAPGAFRAELVAAGSIDVVIVDPPRKGLGHGGVTLVAELAAPTVIYVSCEPASLARDLAALADHGYVAHAIEPFDLMPGTAQVETVVSLRRQR